jgi:hypothetical protein
VSATFTPIGSLAISADFIAVGAPNGFADSAAPIWLVPRAEPESAGLSATDALLNLQTSGQFFHAAAVSLSGLAQSGHAAAFDGTAPTRDPSGVRAEKICSTA